MNEETKPTMPESKQPVLPIKPAAKPTPKTVSVASDPTAPQMSAGKDDSGTVFKAVAKAVGDALFQQPAEKSISPLSAFQTILDKAPKEHLPTMMVRIANKCLAEKVFASPADMAAAIVGASKK